MFYQVLLFYFTFTYSIYQQINNFDFNSRKRKQLKEKLKNANAVRLWDVESVLKN